MNIGNIIVGLIAMLIGLVIYFKKLDIVKSSGRGKESSPLLMIKGDGTQDLILGVKIGFNFIAGVAFFLGLGFVLGEIF